MKSRIILTCYFLLFNFILFGRNEKYKTVTDLELQLYRDLISSINDTSFVISPLIEESVNSSVIDISRMVNKYGFTKNQFEISNTDTSVIKGNKYFEVVSPDTIIKFRNFGEKMMADAHQSIGESPYYYFIKKAYHKKCICGFSKTIFSQNKTYAITEYFIGCGMDDGRGKTVLMKKTKQKWIVIGELAFDVS